MNFFNNKKRKKKKKKEASEVDIVGHNDIGRDNCCLIEERTRSLIEKQKGELNIVGAMVGNPNMAGSQGNNKSSEMTTIFIYKKLNMYFFFGWSLLIFFLNRT